MKRNISGAEWCIMQVLWECGNSMTSAEIVEKINDESKRSPRTIKTLLQRLVSKGFVDFTIDPTDSRVYHYIPKVSESECIGRENHDFLSLYYKGDIGSMLARFIGDGDLTSEQIKELSELLDSKRDGKL